MRRLSNYVFATILISILIMGKSYADSPNSNNSKPFTVVIDPGHGGKDPGAVSFGVREKDVVLAIGKKLGRFIAEENPDVKVLYTRNSDIFVPLIDRSKLANKNKANLFISLHANFCGTPSIKGTETFVLGLHRSEDNLEIAKKENSVILLEDDYSTTYEGFDPNLSESYIMFELTQDIYMDQSLSFADAIQQQFKINLDNPNRGVKQAGFLVLRHSSMPSVLVEAGFLSNANEAAYLNTEAGQQAVAKSIYEAFKHFKPKKATSTNSVTAENTSSAPIQTNKEISKQEVPEIKPEIIETKPVSKPETKPKPTKNEIVPASPKQESIPEIKQVEKTESKTEKLSTPNLNTYFSVQIGANTTPVEPVAANFKGLKNVRREKTDKYYRYFVGQETTLEQIMPVWERTKLKFPESFIVSFTDGQRTILDPKTFK